MEGPLHPRERRKAVKLLLALVLSVSSFPLFGAAQGEWPDLSGSWALFQVISDYWEVPLLGERPRRIYQIAKIHVDQTGADLILRSENICAMVFDMGTSLVQISITPAFLSAVKIGPSFWKTRALGKRDRLGDPGVFCSKRGSPYGSPLRASSHYAG
jgi:hypothetical protein